MDRCNDDCSVCCLKGKALCPNKTIVINVNNMTSDTNEFIRGKRAKLPMIDDDWFVPKEVIDEVVKPFIKKKDSADKEKQIVEMANVVDGNSDNLRIEECIEIAASIYDKGYRKQVAGKWIRFDKNGTTCTCSNCHISQTVNIYNDKVMFKYCPYCGAKMEG